MLRRSELTRSFMRNAAVSFIFAGNRYLGREWRACSKPVCSKVRKLMSKEVMWLCVGELFHRYFVEGEMNG